MYPHILGAASWYSPSYSPQTRLFYQAVREAGSVVFQGRGGLQAGNAFTGGGGRTTAGDEAWGTVRALEATTGKLKWEFPLLSPGYTSLLSTAGGLVFGGTEEGNLFALDAESGKPLWDVQVGGQVRGFPVCTRSTASSTSRSPRGSRCSCSVCRAGCAPPAGDNRGDGETVPHGGTEKRRRTEARGPLYAGGPPAFGRRHPCRALRGPTSET